MGTFPRFSKKMVHFKVFTLLIVLFCFHSVTEAATCTDSLLAACNTAVTACESVCSAGASALCDTAAETMATAITGLGCECDTSACTGGTTTTGTTTAGTTVEDPAAACTGVSKTTCDAALTICNSACSLGSGSVCDVAKDVFASSTSSLFGVCDCGPCSGATTVVAGLLLVLV